MREVLVWSGLSHPNILPFYGFHFNEQPLQALLICPWQQEGSIKNYPVGKRDDVSLTFRLVGNFSLTHSED